MSYEKPQKQDLEPNVVQTLIERFGEEGFEQIMQAVADIVEESDGEASDSFPVNENSKAGEINGRTLWISSILTWRQVRLDEESFVPSMSLVEFLSRKALYIREVGRSKVEQMDNGTVFVSMMGEFGFAQAKQAVQDMLETNAQLKKTKDRRIFIDLSHIKDSKSLFNIILNLRLSAERMLYVQYVRPILMLPSELNPLLRKLTKSLSQSWLLLDGTGERTDLDALYAMLKEQSSDAWHNRSASLREFWQWVDIMANFTSSDEDSE